MGKYSESPDWEDVVPIAQDDGGPNPLAVIAYTDAYSEASSYLRAVMAQDEKSERALDLTKDLIQLNPAHYTVWLYRADIISNLKKDLIQELEWVNSIALKHLKNYQIWHHRQTIMDHVDSLPEFEIPFLNRMFAKDAKNYHVWSYRSWLVRRFDLWDSELPFIEKLLDSDVRNNSAWNHRWFVVFGRQIDPQQGHIKAAEAWARIDEDIVLREIDYAKVKVTMAPQNQSPWNYLRGILRCSGKGITHIKNFVLQFASEEEGSSIRSSHALETLADIYAEERETYRALSALELLGSKYDPIRKNFWDYKSQLLKSAG